jgi:hypothetical protein
LLCVTISFLGDSGGHEGFEIGSHCGAQAGLEHFDSSALAWQVLGITGMHHHTQLLLSFFVALSTLIE